MLAMYSDEHGNVLTAASQEAAAAYGTALDHLLHFRPEVTEALDAALAADPSLAMGVALQAYLGILGTEPDDAAAARAALDDFERSVDPGRLQTREHAHLAAARALVDGDWYTGSRVLRDLVVEHPRDALALVVGHQTDFFTGDAVALRDRIGSALHAWSPLDRHYGPVLGMYAFGLEEAGQYDQAAEVGHEAVERDARDVWGVHAVVHTYEMQARFGDGLRFLDAGGQNWQDGNFLTVHNWWHYCLYLLEAGDSVRPLEIYDAVLHNAASQGVAMEMLDAAALLWRLYLEGEDQTARWTLLADAWDAKVPTPHYAFNDMHAVMAYAGAGRLADARRLVQDRARWAAEQGAAAGGPPGAAGSSVTNVAMTRDIGVPVCSALLAFAEARYDETVQTLLPLRYAVNRFGGSHAQRDAVQRTLLEAALRSGRLPLARALVSERLGVRACSPYNWLKQAALARAVGDSAAAAAAVTRADQLQRVGGATRGPGPG
jgi:hypothetical protein